MFPADVFNGWEELRSKRGFRSSREVEAADDSYDILRAIKVQGARARLGEEDGKRAMNRGIAQPAAELISIYREGRGLLMRKLRGAVLAAVLATGAVGCATFCDECDDFPSPGGPGGFSFMPGSYAGPPLSAAPDPGPAGVSSSLKRPAPSGSAPSGSGEVPRGEQISPPPAPAASRDAASAAPAVSSDDSPVAVPAESSARVDSDGPVAVPAESSARADSAGPVAVPAESSSSPAPVLASPGHELAVPGAGGNDSPALP